MGAERWTAFVLRCAVFLVILAQWGVWGSAGSPLGLSPGEKKLVSKAWNIFKKDPKMGEAILLDTMRTHPATQRQFPQFADLPLEKLASSEEFKVQGRKTLEAFSRVVDDLDKEDDRIDTFLASIGDMHRVRQVPIDDFERFNVSVVRVMKTQLGSKMSRTEKRAVQKMMAAVLQRIIDQYESTSLPTTLEPHTTARRDNSSVQSGLELQMTTGRGDSSLPTRLEPQITTGSGDSLTYSQKNISISL